MGKVLGFVGWPCAGKDEAAEYLEKNRGAYRFGHSDFIRACAAELGIEIRLTSQLSALFEAWADAEGYGWIAKLVSEQILEIWTRAPRALVVISGVRNMAEVEVYRELPGFQLVKFEDALPLRPDRLPMIFRRRLPRWLALDSRIAVPTWAAFTFGPPPF